MLVKKPSVVAAFYNSHSSLPSNPLASSTSSPDRRRRGTRPSKRLRKDYTTIAGEQDGRPPPIEHQWPEPPRGRLAPTPYQILDQHHNAAYTKARYYELVKVYHPDRGECTGDISDAVRIERYRLVVTAHAILSNPLRRRAYDRFGTGWDGKADLVQSDEHGNDGRPGPFTHSWSDRSDTIWQNATWEDWERWRQNQGSTGARTQAPVYFKNAYFIALIGILSIIGSSLNYNRAQDVGHQYIEQRDLVHDRAAKELRRVKEDVVSRGRGERIEWFLRNREATVSAMGHGGSDSSRDETANRSLPGPELCDTGALGPKAD